MVRKISYTWNPKKLITRAEYLNMGVETRALFRDLLDAIWLSETQYKVKLDPETISGMLGVSSQIAQNLIDQCLDGEKSLLTLELDMSTELIYGVYDDFKDEINQFQRYSKEESIKGERSFYSKISSITINEEEGMEIKTDLDVFEGRLPTIRYRLHGQTFPISETLKAKIALIVGEENVNRTLNDVFIWLKRYPEKRKSFHAMETFVLTWARNSKNEDLDFSDDIEIELQKLLKQDKAIGINP